MSGAAHPEGVMPSLAVEVVYSPAEGQLEQVRLQLPPGSTLAQALAASGLEARHPQLQTLKAGIWGRVTAGDTELRDGDRVEVYRPLVFDPMDSRRRRQAHKAAAATRRPPARVSGNRR